MDNRAALINRLRSITALVLVALYIAGLIAMFMSQVQLGLILWVVSTLGGGGMLYWLHTRNKRREEAVPDANLRRSDSGYFSLNFTVSLCF